MFFYILFAYIKSSSISQAGERMDLFNQYKVVDVSSNAVHDKVFSVMTKGQVFLSDPRSVAIKTLCQELTVQVVKGMVSHKSIGQNRCSVCDSPLEAYKRPINKGNIRALIKIMEAGGGPLHINDMGVAGGDFTKLRHWGLIVLSVSLGVNLGWSLTEKGKEFLNGDVAVWKSVWLFKGEVIGFDPITATVREAAPHSNSSLRGKYKDKIVLI